MVYVNVIKGCYSCLEVHIPHSHLSLYEYLHYFTNGIWVSMHWSFLVKNIFKQTTGKLNFAPKIVFCDRWCLWCHVSIAHHILKDTSFYRLKFYIVSIIVQHIFNAFLKLWFRTEENDKPTPKSLQNKSIASYFLP